MTQKRRVNIKKPLSACVTTSDFMRYAREKAGITRNALSEKSGVDVNTIINWERSDANAHMLAVSLVAGALGITIQEYSTGAKPTDTDDMPDLKSAGEYMKAARKAKGLSRQDLADSLKTNAISIHYYENGNQAPRLTRAQEMADILGVSLDKLVGHKIK